MVGLAEVRGRPRHAAGRRDRRHDPHLPLDLPRRGGGQGRLGDPQGAQAARARPGADRLPDLRPPAVRHGLRRGRGRAAPGGLRGPDRGLGPRLRGQRDRRGPPRRLRHHRRQGRGDDLLQGRAAQEGPHRAARRRAVRGDRPLLRGRQDRRARRADRGGRGAAVARRERGRLGDDARAPRRDGGRRRPTGERAPRRRRRTRGSTRPSRRSPAGASAAPSRAANRGRAPAPGRLRTARYCAAQMDPGRPSASRGGDRIPRH